MREGTLLCGRGRVLSVLAGFVLIAALWSPQSAKADRVTVGGTAVIAYTNGDGIRLRESPSLNGGIIGTYPEGTVVEVRDGPTDGDGLLWYRISIDGVRGYMAADYLALSGSSSSSGDTTVLEDLNLRDGPSTSNGVILVMPAGAMVWVTGSPENGFYPVDYAGTAGWAHGDYLSVSGGSQSSGTGTATVIDGALNLRDGPNTSAGVITVMPDGAQVTLTGSAENGFLSVDYAGMSGWAYSAYLSEGGSSTTASTGTATVIDGALNLRDGPSTSAGVITVMPDGAVVELLGGSDNGFLSVRYNGSEGWAYGAYLATGGSGNANNPPAASGGSIAWPVTGGEWYISQGYNGPYSHYNGGSSYQYYYSFDLARTDGATGGTPVYSPVSGTVRWTEAGSGGMSIDMGNGYAFAFFHVTIDSGVGAGDSVSQGQYLGYISGPGGNGYMGFEHIHISLWQTSDGGNWSRTAVPFSGGFGISGTSFPDTGGSNQYADTVFYP